ncbi:DUF6160 family protein [Ideonella sp. BN130291]|uniref:DUF6160 family protein n=1 Tax=Ideonella sp. BN130291 TaxID=3112940 RepID=UPI002E257D7B|nr:DUF6160 family protein [Ideonella sp. BN130291]
MKLFKLCAVAAALSAAALSASAMTSIQDEELSQVSGQDGVSIVADLNINIGSFTYGDSGNTVSFNNIGITGMIVNTIDVLSGAEFQSAASAALASHGVTAPADIGAVLTATAAATGFTGGDVVQFAFPNVGGVTARPATPTITVASVTTGHGGASFGSFEIKNLDLQGTKVWMYGH